MASRGARRRGEGGPGPGQWVLLCAAGVVILSLTFALGLLVGRQWARQTPGPALAVTEPAKKPASMPRRSGLAEVTVDRLPEVGEKLTFYQTLTEPLDAAPASAKGQATAKAVASGAPSIRKVEAPVAPPAPAPAPPSLPAMQWTVQVAAFKNRRQAEDMQKQLAAAGFHAYVASLVSQDGQSRFRVRVGSFRTREEAANAAERIRSQRSLTTFVTPR